MTDMDGRGGMNGIMKINGGQGVVFVREEQKLNSESSN
jgi:hypothetical protein